MVMEVQQVLEMLRQPPQTTKKHKSAHKSPKAKKVAAISDDQTFAQLPFVFPEISSTILERYNLRDISMNEVRALGKDLREVGVLTAKQYMDFTTPWFGSINIQTGEVVTGDTKMDYLAAFERVISFFKMTDASDTETITNLENTQSLFLSLARQLV